MKTNFGLTLISALTLCFSGSFLSLAGLAGQGKEAPKGEAPKMILVPQLEKLPIHSISVQTPFGEKKRTYTGPLLRDVVKELGTEASTKLILISSDGSKVEFTKSEFESLEGILATRADGKRLSKEERGPVRVIFSDRLTQQQKKDVDGRWLGAVADIKFFVMTIRLP